MTAASTQGIKTELPPVVDLKALYAALLGVQLEGNSTGSEPVGARTWESSQRRDR
jgi:hypothetical protein